MADTLFHFGYFVRQEREKQRLSLRGMGDIAGVTEKRLWQIERMPSPEIHPDTYRGIASALGMTVSELDSRWKSTAVVIPEKRRSTPNVTADAAKMNEMAKEMAERYAVAIRQTLNQLRVDGPIREAVEQAIQRAQAQLDAGEIPTNPKSKKSA